MKVAVLEVILHVIPEIHCGEERGLGVRLKPEPPRPDTLLGHGKACPRMPPELLTSNTAVGLPDMVEPQSWQVQQLAGPHCAVEGPCLAVTGVPAQVWSQGVQWDPGYLETQKLPGSRP